MNEEYVKVPVSELRKLEDARVALFEWLERRDIGLGVSDPDLYNATGQIWRVANTKDWEITITNEFATQVELIQYVLKGGTIEPRHNTEGRRNWVHEKNGTFRFINGHDASGCNFTPDNWIKALPSSSEGVAE